MANTTSVVFTKNVKAFNNKPFHVEIFNSAADCMAASDSRSRSPMFTDYREDIRRRSSWFGVKDFDEVRELMIKGYQPAVKALEEASKTTIRGEMEKLVSFRNNVEGFAPIVPLALMGVPQCMLDTKRKPVKCKVLNIYYDMTANSGTSSKELLEAGKKLLSAVIALEMHGYKFNIWSTQNYWDGTSADMLVTKIKNSNTPLDIKRMSFPMTHVAYFRGVGFDWYSRFPGARYRGGLGHSVAYDYNMEQVSKGFEELFGEKAVVFSAAKLIGDSVEHIREQLLIAGGNK